ncbi:3-phosphoshikimate 1-carboxyvinyltransferase [Flavobacterium antarcticum]|uniref:3-phosphoshikimate 1-carboxyvinyltransferase n=1 Tax=Flavobacterium antarcticum TaxID=271155 RepID=UPI0003B4CBA5|nr:3-phosphoshikimate 1-carboxyvinyltransferase [Flavobacterium antarcticum]
MKVHLQHSKIKPSSEISITGSKSETNRLLLLQALFPNLTLENTSNSDDSEVMVHALSQISRLTTDNGQPITVDVHHAGTAMRFLTAYFAIQPNNDVILTGSSRMKERPIHILVEALNTLGAQISYEEKVGFPPIRIKGTELQKREVSLEANTSSQFISALLLIAPKLKNGLQLHLKGEITSLSYIKMTLALLKEIGVETSFENKTITIQPANYKLQPITITVESDWSSASYFYSIVALSAIGTQITLSSYKRDSLQGDSNLVEIYKDFGVETIFNHNETITISKVNYNINSNKNLQPTTDNVQLKYNLNNCPDIAQTIAVTCFGLGLGCELTGLHTLKIKETDRLEALKTELSKLGATISVTADSLLLKAAPKDFDYSENVSIATYQDHRMAMAFAPLALKTSLLIEDAEVVSKSYPDFWEDLKRIGISIK